MSIYTIIMRIYYTNRTVVVSACIQVGGSHMVRALSPYVCDPSVRTERKKEKNMRGPTNILILAREQFPLILLEAASIVLPLPRPKYLLATNPEPSFSRLRD